MSKCDLATTITESNNLFLNVKSAKLETIPYRRDLSINIDTKNTYQVG